MNVYHLRISEPIRHFIFTCSASIGDFIPFFYFLISIILLYDFVYSVLECEFPGDNTYQDIDHTLRILVGTYVNSMGDIYPPTYKKWSDKVETEPYHAWTMITLIWLAWFSNQFMCLVILLNIINGIFGCSYEAAMGKMNVQRR